MKLEDGMKVSGYIQDTFIEEGEIYHGEGSLDYFFLQNKEDGSNAPDKRGYKYSWVFHPSGEEYDASVRDIKIISKKGEPMSLLKKATKFVEMLSQPVKNYYRLGWVEVKNDEIVVTDEGKTAFITAQMVEGKQVDVYAAEEVKRIEKEEKESKK